VNKGIHSLIKREQKHLEDNRPSPIFRDVTQISDDSRNIVGALFCHQVLFLNLVMEAGNGWTSGKPVSLKLGSSQLEPVPGLNPKVQTVTILAKSNIASKKETLHPDISEESAMRCCAVI